jgi:hypothetical protein
VVAVGFRRPEAGRVVEGRLVGLGGAVRRQRGLGLEGLRQRRAVVLEGLRARGGFRRRSCATADSRRRRRRQREKAPRRVATRPAHRRLALGAEALHVRARRDERSRRQRQDEWCNAHRCNLSFTPAAPRRRRAVTPVLLLSLPKCSSPSRSRRTRPHQRTRRDGGVRGDSGDGWARGAGAR